MKTCAHCGAQRVEGKESCTHCGKTDHDPIDHLASTSRLPILWRPDLRKFLWAGAAALVFAAAVAGVAVLARHRAVEQRRLLEQRRAADEQRVADERRAGEQRARLAALRVAYDAIDRVESAVAGGVSFVEYGSRLRGAAAVLDAYEAADEPARQVRMHLAAALEQHWSAHRLLALMVEVGRPAETSAGWFRRYRRRHPDVYAGTAATGRAALKDTWSRATLEMQAARDGVVAYGKPR